MASGDVIREGDDVLVYFSKKYKYILKARRGSRFASHKGIVDFDDIIGKEYGSVFETDIGERFWVTKPNVLDYIDKFRRPTQIVYPKDAAYIALIADVRPGNTVVEAGIGSGALTAVLARLVAPDGKVIAYEVREEFAKVAMKNLEWAGLSKYVTVKIKDITEGIDEVGVDAVVLDMAMPWAVVKHAWRALKHGGVFVAYTPTIEQAMKVVAALRREGFIDICTVEILLREWKVEAGETRPETWMVAHTGFITYGRRP